MTEITVNGMTCTSCATHVKDALEKIPGVNAAVVSYPESRAQVMADTAVSHNQLLAAIAAAWAMDITPDLIAAGIKTFEY